MNTSKTIVRLDAEQRTAEIEMTTSHNSPRVEGLDHALRRIGFHPMRTIELSTPRFRVTRTKLVELDGAQLSETRIMQALRAAGNLERERESVRQFRAA